MAVNMYGTPGLIYKTRGANYTPDRYGYIANVGNNDVDDMIKSGAFFQSVGGVLGRAFGVDMNSTADQPISLQVPPGARYGITKIWVANASISLTTAAGGIYTAASKGGTAIVAAAQAYAAYTGPTVFAGLTVVAGQLAVVQTANPLYLSLTTPQGAAATADVFVYGDLLG